MLLMLMRPLLLLVLLLVSAAAAMRLGLKLDFRAFIGAAAFDAAPDSCAPCSCCCCCCSLAGVEGREPGLSVPKSVALPAKSCCSLTAAIRGLSRGEDVEEPNSSGALPLLLLLLMEPLLPPLRMVSMLLRMVSMLKRCRGDARCHMVCSCGRPVCTGKDGGDCQIGPYCPRCAMLDSCWLSLQKCAMPTWLPLPAFAASRHTMHGPHTFG